MESKILYKKKGYLKFTFLIIIIAASLLINKTFARGDYVFTVNVKIALDGFYDKGKGEMNYCDVIKLALRETSPPYQIIEEASATFDKSNLTAVFYFKQIPEGNFYLQVKHRNSVEVWSREGGESVPEDYILNYDFTDSKSKTYGECLQNIDKTFCFYSGDVDQDGIIDATDISTVDNDVLQCLQEGYYATDLNGDNYVDAADWSIIDKYYGKTVRKVTPETGLRPAVVINSGDNVNSVKIENSFKLNQNFPNPFNPSTKISFTLKNASNVNVSVFNVSGKKVSQLADGYMNEGKYEVTWNAANYPSGTYFYVLKVNDLKQSRRMLLLK